MSSVKGWEPLQKGDIVDLVAPGWACSHAEIKASIKVVQSWGLEPRLPKNLFNGNKVLAHTDEMRFFHLKNSLEAKDSKAVWCVRGGYGSLRLLPELKKIRKPKNPKIFLGYSDITTLHYWLYRNWNWPTLHSPLFDRLGTGLLAKSQLNRLQKIIFGELEEVSFKGLKPLNKKAESLKSVKAPIVGGNLCTLVSQMGSSVPVITKGNLLFLEEVGERPHRLDRMFTQLILAGGLKGCKGIVLGDFLLNTKEKRLMWTDVIARFVNECGLPVYRGLPVGHGKVQRTLPLGASATLVKDKGHTYELIVKTGAK